MALNRPSDHLQRILKGKYKILRLLKFGGIGLVYEGEYNGNKCIIKEVKPDKEKGKSDYFLKDIKIEAEILSELNHDNIVGYIESFEENHSFFLVEKYVEGEKIGDKYFNNPGSEDEVINYTLQLLDAIEYLHKKQIMHRNINPNNLIITSDNTLMLIDFALAQKQKKLRRSQKAIIFGTPYYAPPEQWEGVTSGVSDIFSIGRTMYFMLTGKIPPDSPYKKLDFTGIKIRKELAEVVMKAAEPEVEDRYESVIEMINNLKAIKGNETVVQE